MVQGWFLQELWNLQLIASCWLLAASVTDVSQNLDPRFFPRSPGTKLVFWRLIFISKKHLSGYWNPFGLGLLRFFFFFFRHCDSWAEDLLIYFESCLNKHCTKRMYSNTASKYGCRRERGYQWALLRWQFYKSSVHRIVSVSSKVNTPFFYF